MSTSDKSNGGKTCIGKEVILLFFADTGLGTVLIEETLVLNEAG